jgi:predicted membrane GTPase involved in stress response
MNNYAARKRVEVSPAAVRLRKVVLNANERERCNRRAAFRPSRISKRNAKRG